MADSVTGFPWGVTIGLVLVLLGTGLAVAHILYLASIGK